MQHSQQHGQALCLQADRQPARIAMRGIDQGLDLDQQRARSLLRHHHAGTRHILAVLRQEQGGGIADPFSPVSVMAKTPSSLTAPKRFLKARTRRKLEWVSPSK